MNIYVSVGTQIESNGEGLHNEWTTAAAVAAHSSSSNTVQLKLRGQNEWREAKVSEPKRMGDRRVLLFKGKKDHIKVYLSGGGSGVPSHFD